MISITYDTSGTLADGLIWQFIHRTFHELPSGQVYCGFVNDKTDEVYACPVDSRHVTGFHCHELDVEIFGRRLGNFVPMSDHGFTIVAPDFVERFQRSRLTGIEFRWVVQVAVNQSRISTPRLALFDVVGKGGICQRLRVDGPDHCLFCGYRAMVCRGCGRLNSLCLICEQATLSPEPTSEDSKQFYYPAGPESLIVEGKDWDGSDCFEVQGAGGGAFVTRRFKEFLQVHKINEMQLKPALLNTEGMEPSNLAGLAASSLT